jgi:hypothetical protein
LSSIAAQRSGSDLRREARRYPCRCRNLVVDVHHNLGIPSGTATNLDDSIQARHRPANCSPAVHKPAAMDRRRSNVRRRILLFCHFGGAGRSMGIELLSDKSILRYYEQIRQQLAADLATENRFRLVGSEPSSKGQSVCGWRSTGGDFGVIRLSGAISLRFAGPTPPQKAPRVNGIKGRSAKVRACKRGAGPVCLGVRPIASTEWSASRSATSATYDAW